MLLQLLNWLGDFWIGVLFLTGLFAIPACIFMLLLRLKNNTQPEKPSAVVVAEAEPEGGMLYTFDGYSLFLQFRGGKWDASIKVGDHLSVLPVEPNESAGKVFRSAVNHLRIPCD